MLVGTPQKILRNESFCEITDNNKPDGLLVLTKSVVSINSSKWGSTLKDLTKNDERFSLSYLEVSSVLDSCQWLVFGHTQHTDKSENLFSGLYFGFEKQHLLLPSFF